jgi:hypothetical protein
MPKTKISEYSSTANSNTDIAGINIDEGCAPSGINNAIRTLMAQLKDLQAGTSGDLLAVTAGGTGVSTSTGSGNNVLSTSPTLVTPALGTPSALVGTNITGTAAGLSIGGTAAIATSAVKVATTNFSIEESGGKLVFKYGATTIASMTSAGVLTVLSNVSSNGTP